MSSETIRKWRPPEEEIVRYKINVSSRYLDLTKRKLELTRLPREVSLPASLPWKLGTPKSALEPLLDVWLESYSWREQEAIINDALPQFRTTIPVGDPRMDDSHSLRLHFVHKRSSAKDAIPLLYIHGYIGSFTEIARVLDPLTSTIPTHLHDSSPAFHVVTPSIPGFGFSDASKDDGFGARATARLLDALMKRLGYERYVVECSCQGWKVARWLVRGANGCIAVHTSVDGMDKLEHVEPEITESDKKASWALFRKSKSPTPKEDLKEKRPITAIKRGRSEAKQAHLPQTVAHGICDSPVGLLAASLNQLYDLGNLHLWSQVETLNWTMLQWLPGPEAALRWAWATEQETFEFFEHECRVRVGVTIYQRPTHNDDDGSKPAEKSSLSKSSILKEENARIPLAWSRLRPGISGIPALDSPSDVIVDLREFCAAGRREGWLLDLNPDGSNTKQNHDGDGQHVAEDAAKKDDEDEDALERMQLDKEEDEVSRTSQWWMFWRWIKTNLSLRHGKHI